MTTKIRKPLSPARACSWFACAAVVLLAGCAAQPPAAPAASASGWTKDEVADSYVFGYPLVVMTTARAAALSGASETQAANVNTLRHTDTLVTAGDTPSMPDIDTLASSAWLDLTAEPILVSLPATRGRYLDARALDMWTNVVWSTGTSANPRNGLPKAQTVAFVPPGWEGKLPAGVERVDAPGKSLWLSVRVAANGAREVPFAKRLQEEVRVAPLSGYVGDEHTKKREPRGKHLAKRDARAIDAAANDPAGSAVLADTPAAQAEAVVELDAATFFTRLADALRDNPPSDAHALKILADLGVKPGEALHLPDGSASAIAAGVAEARTRMGTPPVNGLSSNGWVWLGDGVGHYGEDYALRAYAAYTRPGTGTKDDEVLPIVKADGDGQALDGSNRYVLHFAAKSLPPVRGFWTITAYTTDGALGDAHAARRSINSRDVLRRNRDGSIEIYVQANAPIKAHQSNWLAVPSGPFQLVMRLYAPQARAIDSSWQPPAVTRQ